MKNMYKIIKITGLGKLLTPNYEEFPIILIEKSAEANIPHPWDDYYLWYIFQPQEMISTYDEFLNEKLTVTDMVQAKRIIKDFNKKFREDDIPALEFEPSRKRRSKTLIIPDLGRIVMHDHGVHPKTGVNYGAGRGGYLWKSVE